MATALSFSHEFDGLFCVLVDDNSKIVYPMNSILPQAGLLIMFSYTLFNLYNVLLLRLSISFITLWILSAGIVYLIHRTHRLLQNNQKISQSELTGLILVLLSLTSIIMQYLNLQEYVGADGVQTLKNMRTEWSLSMLWLFAGGAVATFNLKESPTLALIVLALTGLAFLNGLDDQMMVDYQDVIDVGAVEVINHLYLEKHVIFLLILAYCLSPKTKWLVVFTGMFLLFSMQGRTSLLVFALCVVAMNVGKRNVRNIVYIGIIGLLLLFSLRYAIENQIIDTENRRVMRMLLIDGIEADNSYQARKDILGKGLQYLDDQFLYGDPTVFPEKLGSSGYYIHNILSVWQFYGFFVFAFIVLILLFSLRRMIVVKSTNPTPKIIFGSFMLIYVSISVITSKAANWDLLWFILGFWTLLPTSNLKQKRRSKRQSRGYKF